MQYFIFVRAYASAPYCVTSVATSSLPSPIFYNHNFNLERLTQAQLLFLLIHNIRFIIIATNNEQG